MTTLYDRSYKMAAIVNLAKVREEDRPKFVEALKAAKLEVTEIKHPSDYAVEVAESLGKKGYKAFAQAFPYQITGQESLVLLSECVKKFNKFAMLRIVPDPSRVNRICAKPEDLVRIIEELMSQQDGISVSQIWDTGKDVHKIGIMNTEHLIAWRMTHAMIPVARNPQSKKNDERVEKLIAEVTASVDKARAEEEKDKEEAKYRRF